MANILLVDDEEEILMVYKKKLERSGFKVFTASNGEEAIALAKSQHPDLMIMDMKMPVMDGITAQQKIRELPELKGLKVVFLTAFSDPMKLEIDEDVAKQVGAVGFIRKGIDLDELVVKVKGYLDQV